MTDHSPTDLTNPSYAELLAKIALLEQQQKRSNTQKSQTRNTVERVFGHFKLHYGMSKARHLGLMQFHTSTVLASIVHNLKTALSLKQKYGLA